MIGQQLWAGLSVVSVGAVSAAAPEATDPNIVATKSNYGFLAFLVFFCIALAVWVIARSLNKHLRRLHFLEQEERAATQRAQEEQGEEHRQGARGQ